MINQHWWRNSSIKYHGTSDFMSCQHLPRPHQHLILMPCPLNMETRRPIHFGDYGSYLKRKAASRSFPQQTKWFQSCGTIHSTTTWIVANFGRILIHNKKSCKVWCWLWEDQYIYIYTVPYMYVTCTLVSNFSCTHHVANKPPTAPPHQIPNMFHHQSIPSLPPIIQVTPSHTHWGANSIKAT